VFFRFGFGVVCGFFCVLGVFGGFCYFGWFVGRGFWVLFCGLVGGLLGMQGVVWLFFFVIVFG